MEKSIDLTINGRKVTVTTEMAEHGARFVLRAECEGEVVEHSVTIGPAEGAGPADYDEGMVQRDLDRERQKVAAQAAWQARIRTLMEAVV